VIRALLAALILLPASALAQPRSEVWLVNATGRVIERLAVVPAGTRTDTPQEAIAEPMAPGQGVRVMPGFPGCRIDILMLFADGGRASERNVDACRQRQVPLRARRDVELPILPSPPMAMPEPPAAVRGRPVPGIEAPNPWGISPPGSGLFR
jgi:hypothetical protein